MGRFQKTITGPLSSLLSGLLLYLSFPPYNFSFLVWISLIPLLVSLCTDSYLKSFFLAFLTGAVFWALHVQWVNVVPNLPFVAFLFIVFFCALFFGLFGLSFTFVIHRTKWPKVLVAPFLWVTIEYIRSHLSFMSLPGALLGHSQHENIPIIQIASLASVYGISFLIVLVNAAFTEGLIFRMNFIRGKSFKTALSVRVISSIAGAVIAVLITYLWGFHQVQTLGSKEKDMLTVSLIQGNIPQNQKWDSGSRKMIMERYHDLTLKASNENPDLIVWPESSIPGDLMKDFLIHQSVMKIIRETGLPLLLGSSTQAKIGKGNKSYLKPINTAFLLDGMGRPLCSYNKMRLLPFAEYLPLKGRFPWPRWLVPDSGNFVPGRNPVVFRFPKGNFGVVICWENLFPDVFRKFVEQGSQFMVNLTNEAWFEKSAASQQILAMSVFRAVENRVSLLRCANTGITCIIDPLGRVRGKVTDEKGNDIMVSGILTIGVPEPAGPTLYTKYGDVFAVICCICAALLIISALLPEKARRYLRLSG